MRIRPAVSVTDAAIMIASRPSESHSRWTRVALLVDTLLLSLHDAEDDE